MPLAPGYMVTSPFGPRDGGYHWGVDFGKAGGSAGLPVYACQAGTVIHAGAASGYGGPDPAGWLVIDSDTEQGGGCLEYGHIIREVSKGAKVAAGQRIGRINPDSRTNGGVAPHLHLAVHEYDYASDYVDPGQWLRGAGVPINPPPPPKGPTVAPPQYREIDMMGNNRSNRFGAAVLYFLFHTEEGNASAQGLAASGNSSGNFSYHYCLRDRIVADMVDTDYGSWSVLDANNRTINLVFAGSRASMSRAEWLARRDDLRIAAWLAVQDMKKYPIGKVVQGRPYPLGNRPCVSDHYFVTKILRIGDHTDVGPNFPWDVVEADVREFLTGAPVVPPENLINKEAAKAAWLGKRITPGEESTPARGGKWAKFENGYVYFSPTTGAHAIPNYIFATWASMGYEAGVCGFPTGSHAVLKDAEVQGFEGGAIYRRGHPGQNEQVGVLIGGKIRDKWNKSGFENGPYGFPVSNEISTKSGAKYQQFEKGRMAFSPDSVVGLFTQDGPDVIN